MNTERSIILLTGKEEAVSFKEFLLTQNDKLKVEHAANQVELKNLVDKYAGHVRLISFLTDVIVPQGVLQKLKVTPYNIHPGPPERPGSSPDVFAIWEQDERYGVTAHEITTKVDEGDIVAVMRFPMPPTPERLSFADFVYAQAIKVFAVIGAHCAETDAPLPKIAERWSGQKTTRKQLQTLCIPPSDLSLEDRERLKRACGPDFLGE